MRAKFLILVLAAATLAGPVQAGSSKCEEHEHHRKTTGTLAGAGVGALAGGIIGHGAAAPIVGAAGGAVVGNQAVRRKCYDEPNSHAHHHKHHRHSSQAPANNSEPGVQPEAQSRPQG
jgi:uncharacterized protein YcfJ